MSACALQCKVISVNLKPAVVIQANLLEQHATVTVLTVTCTLVAARLMRISIQPDAINGLQKPFQAMDDKAATVKNEKEDHLSDVLMLMH